VAIHEEFAHPHVDADDKLPALPGSRGGYPLLEVRNSEWIASFSESRLQGDGSLPQHFQFLSLSYFVDVLSYILPTAEWIDPEMLAPIESVG
jgi:hypothetical protein